MPAKTALPALALLAAGALLLTGCSALGLDPAADAVPTELTAEGTMADAMAKDVYLQALCPAFDAQVDAAKAVAQGTLTGDWSVATDAAVESAAAARDAAAAIRTPAHPWAAVLLPEIEQSAAAFDELAAYADRVAATGSPAELALIDTTALGDAALAASGDSALATLVGLDALGNLDLGDPVAALGSAGKLCAGY